MVKSVSSIFSFFLVLFLTVSAVLLYDDTAIYEQKSDNTVLQYEYTRYTHQN